MEPKTNVYIDGFNFYYGALRKTSHKWLDPALLCQNLIPKNRIHRIRYFTARVGKRGDDQDQATRQEMYLRALRTLPNLTIHLGHFIVSQPHMRRVDNGKYVQVIKTEEKGSDVNLASYVLTDAYQSDYDVAVIISNDSDLVYPLEHVRNQLGKTVGILNPHKKPSRSLRKVVHFFKPIRKGVVEASQFPPELNDSKGTFRKPKKWN